MKLYLLVGNCNFSKSLLIENSQIPRLKQVTTKKDEFAWSNEEHFVTNEMLQKLIESKEVLPLIINENGTKIGFLKRDLYGVLIMEASVYLAFLLKSTLKDELITIGFKSDDSGFKTDFVIDDIEYESTLKQLITIINKGGRINVI